MIPFLRHLIGWIMGFFRSRQDLILEKVALRQQPELEPTVSLVVNNGSLEFTVSYILDYANATSMKDRLFTRIVQELMRSNGRLIWASSSSSNATVKSEAASSPTDAFHFLSR